MTHRFSIKGEEGVDINFETTDLPTFRDTTSIVLGLVFGDAIKDARAHLQKMLGETNVPTVTEDPPIPEEEARVIDLKTAKQQKQEEVVRDIARKANANVDDQGPPVIPTPKGPGRPKKVAAVAPPPPPVEDEPEVSVEALRAEASANLRDIWATGSKPAQAEIKSILATYRMENGRPCSKLGEVPDADIGKVHKALDELAERELTR